MLFERLNVYTHLIPSELDYVGNKKIFFDPPDTEVGCWVGNDLMKDYTENSVVLDLGSGSGATIASFIRNKAQFAVGLDISEDSLDWSRTQYTGGSYKGKTKFLKLDFLKFASDTLAMMLKDHQIPNIVTSNPPYVPMVLKNDEKLASIYGGEDGLLYFHPALQYALHFKAAFGITLGSYSSIKTVTRLLASSGYVIKSVTLSVLPFSEPTVSNFSQIEKLLHSGEALIWNKGNNIPYGYIIIGIAAKYVGVSQKPKVDFLFDLLKVACSSNTTALEKLEDGLFAESYGGTLRVLELPQPSKRSHW